MTRPLLPSALLRNKLDVYVSAAERSALVELAKTARLPISTFVRLSALGKKIEAPAPEINLICWRELARSAANLNQLTHAVNSGFGEIDINTLSELSVAIAALRLSLTTKQGAK